MILAASCSAFYKTLKMMQQDDIGLTPDVVFFYQKQIFSNEHRIIISEVNIKCLQLNIFSKARINIDSPPVSTYNKRWYAFRRTIDKCFLRCSNFA